MASPAERQLLKSAYPASKTWAQKVDKMSDAQVIAVLMRLKSKGIIKT